MVTIKITIPARLANESVSIGLHMLELYVGVEMVFRKCIILANNHLF
jgi:hypothetical protein